MEKKMHRGRLIDHLHIVVEDITASRKFYEAVFKAVNVPIGGSGIDYFWADEFFVSSKDMKGAAGKLTGRSHFAFQADSREVVETFYQEGLKAGGRDNGAPGERPYHPGYFAAFLLDPDGNNVEVVYHGPAKKSAPSVEITF